MTERERIFKLLNGEKPDRIPWFGDLDYWASSLIYKKLQTENFVSSIDYINWHNNLGVGFYLQGSFPFKTVFNNVEIKEWKDGYKRYREIHTPAGKLKECWQFIPESFTEAPTEHLVKSIDDLPAYRYLYENLSYQPEYDYINARLSQVGESGFVMGYLPKSPLMQMIALDAGIITVTDIFYTDEDELTNTLSILDKSHTAAGEIAVNSPAEVLMIPENLSSEVVGKKFYNRYMLPYHKYWTEKIKSAGKYSTIHIDGTLQGLLREVSNAGFTFLEAMTPAPVGDLHVREWENFSQNDQVIFWGGIPGIYFTNLVSDAEFDRHVIETLEIFKTKPRFVLGVADQVPPDGMEYRVKRVRELVDKYGNY